MNNLRDITDRFEKLGVGIPEILLPSDKVDLTKWSVVACDQYTSQPEYWNEVEKLVGDNPSTLHLTLPEVYLEEDGVDERIAKINGNMKAYLSKKTLVSLGQGFIYIDRKTSHVPSRKGLIISIDLEKYDFNKGSQTLIRATEGTVLERIPPRVKIRKNASIELPHIMLLIDDPSRSVIELLAEKTGQFEKLYDFDLMMEGGHVEGYRISSRETLSAIVDALEKLADPRKFGEKYGVDSGRGVLLFAVGDGNHSLASAKAHWENIKPTLMRGRLETHPARFALVEVVNVHDEGLVFEPIHRILFNVDTERVLEEMASHFNSYSEIVHESFDDWEELSAELKTLNKNRSSHVIPYITGNRFGLISVLNPKYNLEVGTLQAFLDVFAGKDKNVKIDYIHGEDVVTALGLKEGNIGFYLPPTDKHDLFKTVILEGALPRKTFSMGEASEKRFYLECRRITPAL